MHSTDSKLILKQSKVIKLMCKNNTNCAYEEDSYYIKCNIDMKERYFYFEWTKDNEISDGSSCKVYSAFEIDDMGNVIDKDIYNKSREWVVKIFNIVDKSKHEMELKFTKRFSDAVFGQFIDASLKEHDYILMEKKLDSDLFDHVADQSSEVMQASFDEKIKFFCILLLQASRMHNRTVQGNPFAQGDLKPENIRISTDNGNIVDAEIIDFDISRDLKNPHRPKRCKTFGGSLPYSPLEVYKTNKIGTKSDVYSLALIFCQFLTKNIFFAHNMTGWMFNTKNITIDPLLLLKEQVTPQTKKPKIEFACDLPELKLVVTKFLWRMLDLDYNKRPHTNAALQFFTTLYNCCLASTTRMFAGRDYKTIKQPPAPQVFVLNWAKLELICADLWDDYEALSAAPKHMRGCILEAVLLIACGNLGLLEHRSAATFTASYSCSNNDDTIISTHKHSFLSLDFINRHYSVINQWLLSLKYPYPTVDLRPYFNIPDTAFERQFSNIAKRKHYDTAPTILAHTRKTTTEPLSYAEQNNDIVNKKLFVDNWVIYAYKNGKIAMKDSKLNHIKWEIELSNQTQNMQFLLLPDDQLLCVYIDQYNIVNAKLLNCKDGNILEPVDYTNVGLPVLANNICDFSILKTKKGKPLAATRVIVKTIDNIPRLMLQQLVRLPSANKVLSMSWSDNFVYIVDCARVTILNKLPIKNTQKVKILRNGDFICITDKHMLLCKF